MNNPAPLPPVAAQHTPLLARKKFFGSSGNFTPYISRGDSAEVLCFLNLSGAYGGYAGQDKAMEDAQRMADCYNALSGVADPAAYVAALETALREIALELECAGIRLRYASIQARANNARTILAQRQRS